MDKREQIRDVLNSYRSIIDFDEPKEVFHLFMDIMETIEEE